jgi:hypothetical protein
MEFRFKDPRRDQWTANAVLGTSDVGLTLEGPTGENSSLIMSVRRSYLQLLFEVIGLPFLPIYNDYQYKWTWRPDDKNAITVLGLGALDDFELNTELAKDTAAEDYLSRVAILDVLPISEQWNYMQGLKWDRYKEDGKWTFVLSRNMLNNAAFKHVDNDTDLPKTLDYVSQEIENKFRAERFRSGAADKRRRVRRVCQVQQLHQKRSLHSWTGVPGGEICIGFPNGQIRGLFPSFQGHVEQPIDPVGWGTRGRGSFDGDPK